MYEKPQADQNGLGTPFDEPGGGPAMELLAPAAEAPVQEASDLANEVPPSHDETRRLPAALSAAVAIGTCATIYALYGTLLGKKVQKAIRDVEAARVRPDDDPEKADRILAEWNKLADAALEEQREEIRRRAGS